jgi:hypothetical protein
MTYDVWATFYGVPPGKVWADPRVGLRTTAGRLNSR